jgi:TRAP transporter TAXI family solute receptor
MSTKRKSKQGFIFCQVVSLVLLLASCSRDEIPSLSIGTGSMQGNYVVAGRALARIVNENEATYGFQLEYVTSSGSVSNIDALISGDTQFGIAQADHQYRAVKGLGEWGDKGPQEDLRAVFNLYTESVSLFAGRDTDIRTIHDLDGKLVDIGMPGSGTQRNAIDVLSAAGIDWKSGIRAREENMDVRLSEFMGGEIDAFFFTVGHPNRELKFATFSVRGVRIIPLTNIDSLVADNPYFSRMTIPSELYPKADNEVDVETIGVNATLLTSAKVSDDVVYAVTKAAFENLESLAEYSAEFSAILDDRFLEGLMTPIHPGALKYYREIGLQIPPQ